jgi:radical SAM superfamily enzyme YgiQ (UPF0313 family)
MKVLLSSVFGPYGVDDAYGRKENVMELFHNQVTREQGLFSLRMHHPSYGLHFMAANLAASTVVLDFPDEARFVKEIKKGYDYVGISFIVPNFIKAQRMAKLVREHAPKSKIVLGGHGTRIPGIEAMIEHDHICRGEGVRFMRELLGEDVDRPFKHPAMISATFKKIMGMPISTDSAVLIPGVGCPNACRFCATSHFFDKAYIAFFDSGEKLFDVCLDLERRMGTREFFVMDENFLKRTARVEELLDLMEFHGKEWRFGIFSSAEAIRAVGVPFLARLGVHFLWVGVESRREVYEKNRGADLGALIGELKDHGISVLASGILFLEHHDKQSIRDDIEYVASLGSDYVQYMELGPLPGTKLYADYDARGILRKDLPYEEWHGQHEIWFEHPHFSAAESAQVLRDAFRFEYDRNGPSLVRMCDTIIRGVATLAKSDDAALRHRAGVLRRWAREYRPLLRVAREFAHNARSREIADAVMDKYKKILGPEPLWDAVRTRALAFAAERETVRIAAGFGMYQPRTLLTKYRQSVKDLVAQYVKGRDWESLLKLDVERKPEAVVVTMDGNLDGINVKTLAMKLRRYLKKEQGAVILDVDGVAGVEGRSLEQLLMKVRKYRGRVKIRFDEGTEALKAAIEALPAELAALFETPCPQGA